jgi:hypothetical protein
MVYLIQILRESKRYIIFSLLLYSSILYSQKNTQLELNISRSTHGTGDINGFNFSSNYINTINNKLSYLISFGGSTHHGKDVLFYNVDNRNIDGSILFTTSGIQLGFGLDYKFINFKTHTFRFRLVPFLRYQSTSIPDVSTILFPPLTELPIPVIFFEQNTPSETLAIGLETNIVYNFSVSSSISLNLVGSFQFDTNGDTIRGFGLGIAKSF